MNRRKKIIIIASVVALFIVGVIAALILKNRADDIASTYRGEVKAYVEKVHRTVANPDLGIQDATKAVKDMPKPELVYVPLGNLSSHYNQAANDQKDLNTRLDSATSKLEDMSGLYELRLKFNQYAKDINNELYKNDAETDKELAQFYKNNVAPIYEQQKKLLDESNLPPEIDDSVKELSTVYGKIVSALNRMASTVETDDREAYLAAYKDFRDLINQAVEVIKQTNQYNIVTERKELVDQLNQLKKDVS